MASEPVAKKLNSCQTIGTHNGTFHCDEVLACCMLRLLPQYEKSEIIRTRDKNILDTCDVVVDVGGVYEPSSHRYDHHQRSFSGTMNSLGGMKWDIKLSSAGLVYLHFGKDILATMFGVMKDDAVVGLIYEKVYENFVQEIDAIDNGVNQYDGEPRYTVSTNISSRVAALNPKWNDKDPDPENCFQKAMEMVGAEFLENVNYFKNSWLPARTIVQKAIEDRHKVHSSGEIIILEGAGPWKDHMFSLEKDLNVHVSIKFALYTDNNNKWRIQCVPVSPKSFENRLSLLEEWRGMRDEALVKISGIPGSIFVHASGFIGGNETMEGALDMAQKTLEKASEHNFQ